MSWDARAPGVPGPSFLPRSRGGSPLLDPFSEAVGAPVLASPAPGPLDDQPRNFPTNAAEGSRVPAAGSVGAQDARSRVPPWASRAAQGRAVGVLRCLRAGRRGARVPAAQRGSALASSQSAFTRRQGRRPKHYFRKTEGQDTAPLLVK